MTEQEEYEQYLRETGQAPAAKKPRDPADSIRNASQFLYGQPDGPTNEQIGASAENALAAMSGGLSKMVPAMGKGAAKLVTPYIEGGLTGAASDSDDRLRGFFKGAFTQGVTANAGQAFSKTGDRAMQWAVGRKKYTPDVGTELANQGIFGTRGMMRNQVASRLDAVGEKMKGVADDIPAIDSRAIGREATRRAVAPHTGGGLIEPAARDAGTVASLREFGDDIMSRGTETGRQALARRAAAGSSAYSPKTNDPKLSPIAKASKIEQQLYSEALKTADPRMVPLDKSYGALKRAELPLNQEEAISGFAGLASSIGKAVAQPVSSIVGQTGAKGGKLLEWLAPLTRQQVISSPTPEERERAEYEQYLRETGQK